MILSSNNTYLLKKKLSRRAVPKVKGDLRLPGIVLRFRISEIA
jgi:hypothetical protein